MKRKPAPPADIPIRDIRGQRVILDSDLAAIYGVTTKRLNEQCRRNRDRFPEDFVFRLTTREAANLRSQTGTSSGLNWSQIATSSTQPVHAQKHRGATYLPYAFTEHGALQAANILRSPRAVAMSVFVIRAFVQMRAAFLQTDALAKQLAELDRRLTGRLDVQEEAIVKVMRELIRLLNPPQPPPRPPKPRIGFHREND